MLEHHNTHGTSRVRRLVQESLLAEDVLHISQSDKNAEATGRNTFNMALSSQVLVHKIFHLIRAFFSLSPKNVTHAGRGIWASSLRSPHINISVFVAFTFIPLCENKVYIVSKTCSKHSYIGQVQVLIEQVVYEHKYTTGPICIFYFCSFTTCSLNTYLFSKQCPISASRLRDPVITN